MHKPLSQDEIRSSFLEFFKQKGCVVFPSSSLVPEDPSLLLTNAGMNQFKNYYLGTKTLKGGSGATSCQKCLRTNDIDAIGLDGRHLSFFEMLGNFSFGGYTKRDACTWALEYVRDILHLDLSKLYFTVFQDDDEAEEIWKGLGIGASHISRLGEEDNFWAAGPTGPCGPCSEIYVDLGEDVGCGRPECAPGCDCDRFMEIWNLVFTQYDRQEDGTLRELPHQNVDTGMGLERVSAVVKGVASSYECDALATLVACVEKLAHVSYGEDAKVDTSVRIIADHARAVTFMLADGILPSNEGRGYVLRRLLRRAIFHGRLLGIDHEFLTTCVTQTIETMGKAYDELHTRASFIQGAVHAEEVRFWQTLETGRAYLDEELAKLATDAVLSGHTAFTLHDTYGFPLELTQEIAAQRGHVVELESFEADMKAQKERARKASATAQDAWTNIDIYTELSEKHPATVFDGYETVRSGGCIVLEILVDSKPCASASEGDVVEVILNHTPFYAEKGGQVGDTGELYGVDCKVRVDDTQVHEGDIVSHKGEVIGGELRVGEPLVAEVASQRRHLIERNHTATHLLDAALKRVLGDHVNQAGSFVGPNRLRFDFTHFEGMTREQIEDVEALVNDAIIAALPVHTEVMSLSEAKQTGAIALFGEKYGDRVRVVYAGDKDAPFSLEFCGGTHTYNTSTLGIFKIVSESSIGSALRRIEAVTSRGALAYINEQLAVVQELSLALKSSPQSVAAAVAELMAREKTLKGRLKEALNSAGISGVNEALAAAINCGPYKAVIAKFDGRDARELRATWDKIHDLAQAPIACFLVSTTPDKRTTLLAAGSQEAVDAGFNAGQLVKQVCQDLGGRGGGKPSFAQGGLPEPTLLEAALEAAKKTLAHS